MESRNNSVITRPLKPEQYEKLFKHVLRWQHHGNCLHPQHWGVSRLAHRYGERYLVRPWEASGDLYLAKL